MFQKNDTRMGKALVELQKRNAERLKVMKSMGMLVYRPVPAQSIAQTDFDTGFMQAFEDGELRK